MMTHIHNSGVGSEMLRKAIHDYYDKGYELMHLYPFRESWYRRFGYEVCGVRYKIKVDSAKFPRVAGSLPVHQYGVEGVEKIRQCYETFAHRRSGLNLRHEGQWERLLPRESNRTIYTAGNPVEAYAIVQHKTDFWINQDIIEFVWTSREGYESILAVLRAIGKNKSSVTWFEPSDSPYRTYFWDNGATLEITNPLMYRVVNVKKALEGLKPTSSGVFTLQVLDEIVPQNAGPWRVAFSPSGVEVTPADSAEIVIGEGHFAQAFLGEPSLLTIASNGFVEVGDAKHLEAAARLLTPSPTLCFEAF